MKCVNCYKELQKYEEKLYFCNNSKCADVLSIVVPAKIAREYHNTTEDKVKW